MFIICFVSCGFFYFRFSISDTFPFVIACSYYVEYQRKRFICFVICKLIANFAVYCFKFYPMKRLFLGFIVLFGVLSLTAQNVYENKVMNCIMARRSVRKYLDKPVEHDKLEAIARAGINAPSARNMQMWAVRIIEDQKLIADVSEVYKKENAEQVAREPNFKNMFRGAPNLICVCAPKDGGFDLDAGLMGENMMLAAQSLGLGTCIQTGPVRFLLTCEDAKFFLERLDIPKDYKLLYVIAVGYPDEKPEAKPRDASKVKYIRSSNSTDNAGDDTVYNVVDVLAEFKGGDAECYKWLSEHIVYPKDCENKKVEGRVLVSFVIRKDGTITDVKAIRSPHLSLSKEAIRIVSEMPQWIPAKINGKDVSMRMTLPVVFKMR